MRKNSDSSLELTPSKSSWLPNMGLSRISAMFVTTTVSRAPAFKRRDLTVSQQGYIVESLNTLVTTTGANHYRFITMSSSSGSYCRIPFTTKTDPTRDDYLAYGAPLVKELDAIHDDVYKREINGTLKQYQHLEQAIKAIRSRLVPPVTSRFIADKSMQVTKVTVDSSNYCEGLLEEISYETKLIPFKVALAQKLLSRMSRDVTVAFRNGGQWPSFNKE